MCNRVKPFWHIDPAGQIVPPDGKPTAIQIANARQHVAAPLADASRTQRLLHDAFPMDHAVLPGIEKVGAKLETIVDELRYAHELLG